MKILKGLAIVLAVLLAVAFGGALLLPASYTVTRNIEIAAPPEAVYALVDDPRQWKHWTVWNQRDPAMQMSYSGAPRGAGAAWAWTSATEGSGSMRFTAAEPGKRIAYTLSFPEFDSTSSGDLLFEPAAGGTRLAWRIDGSMGANPVWRWLGLFADRMIGPDFEAGLANLKALAEKK